MERAVIVKPAHNILGFGYRAQVVWGTVHNYRTQAGVSFWRPTAEWAKQAGERWIRSSKRVQEREWKRIQKARRVTGYEVE